MQGYKDYKKNVLKKKTYCRRCGEMIYAKTVAFKQKQGDKVNCFECVTGYAIPDKYKKTGRRRTGA